MKFRKIFQYVLWAMVILYAGSMRDISAQDISVKVYSLESVTKVEQQHNPALGANTLHLHIEGRSNGKPMSVGISFNSSGWGARKLMDSCEKSAMLVMHYPNRYELDFASSAVGQASSVRIDLTDSTADYVFCSLKVKTKMVDPSLPSTSIMKAPNLDN